MTKTQKRWAAIFGAVILAAALTMVVRSMMQPPSAEDLEQRAVRECESALREQGIPVPDALHPSRKSAREGDGSLRVYSVTSGSTWCEITLSASSGDVLVAVAGRK